MGNILKIATKINAVLKSHFDRKNLKLVNLRIEFGQAGNQILLGDKFSGDSMTVWTVEETGKFEKFKAKGSNKSDMYSGLRTLIAKEK
jgi:phosphoribosylaminoimidazole-succinocarboxamide synthase